MKQVKYIFILLLTLISVRAVAIQISAGGNHTMILMDDGTLWACGYNSYGQLGVENDVFKTEPVKVMDGVAFVSAGNRHTMIIKNDGSLWACGNNSYGQLADGTSTSAKTPIKVMDNVAHVSAGDDFTLIIKKNGTLWACGYNYYGQVGNGTTEKVTEPVQIMTGVAQASAGYYHSLIVKTDGTLWACGYNYYGQLGDGTDGSNTNKTTPVKITNNVAAVAAGAYHSLVLKNDGTMWGCGSNSNLQLGEKDLSKTNTLIKLKENVAQISAGYYHSIILYKNGSLAGLGSDSHAQLGDNRTGYNFYYCNIEEGDVVCAAAGDYFSVYAKSDGTFWACGKNEYGQLGDGSLSRKCDPVQISSGVKLAEAEYGRTIFLKNDNSIWACGKNGSYRLGDGGDESKATPVNIASGDIVQIAAGTAHTLYLEKDGSLYGNGSNTSGQLGISDSYAQFPTKITDNVAQVAAGFYFSLVVKTDGSLWACGNNYDGQLGDGTTTSITSLSKIMDGVAMVAAGGYHSLVLKTDGSLWSAGENSDGQLGNGKTEGSTTFVKVMDGVTQIAACNYQSMAIKSDGSLWAFGSNYLGQLGTGNYDNQLSPVKIADNVASVSLGTYHGLLIKTDGSLWVWGYGHYGQLCNGVFDSLLDTPTKVMDNVAMVSAGQYHSAIVKKDGTLLTCGDNVDGQLGDGTRKYEKTQMKIGSAPVNPDVIEFSANGVTYQLNNDKTATISLITAHLVDLDIPSTIAYNGESYAVTTIGPNVFKGMEGNYIFSITFPKTITTVSDNAFVCSEPICTCFFWSSNTALPAKAFDSAPYKEQNFMLYVNKNGIAPSSVENVIVNGTAESITLKRDRVFNCRKDFTAKRISITHEYTMDTGINGECKGYETFALPFDVQTVTHETQGELTPFANFVKDGGKKPFWLYELSTNGWVKASAIKANTPYLISMPNNDKYTPTYNLKGKVTFSSENVTVYQTEESKFVTPEYNGATFYPLFSYVGANTRYYNINSSNAYRTYEGTEAPGSIFINNYRSSFPFEGVFIKYSNAAPFRIGDIPFVDGETTGIEQVLYGNSIVGSQSDVVRVYTLSGQLISTVKAKDAAKLNLPSGVYVINGKKIIVK